MGYGDPLHRTLWPGPEFAKGVGLAGGAAAVILLLPWDPVALTGPLHAVLPALMVAVFVALALFGSGTELAEDTRINLGGVPAPGAGQARVRAVPRPLAGAAGGQAAPPARAAR